jgi:hypothetical protein
MIQTNTTWTHRKTHTHKHKYTYTKSAPARFDARMQDIIARTRSGLSGCGHTLPSSCISMRSSHTRATLWPCCMCVCVGVCAHVRVCVCSSCISMRSSHTRATLWPCCMCVCVGVCAHVRVRVRVCVRDCSQSLCACVCIQEGEVIACREMVKFQAWRSGWSIRVCVPS